MRQGMLERREMVANLVSRELKARYKGSALGVLWSVLTPLFMAVIYVFFLRLLARGVPLDQVLIGVFAWQFTVQAITGGMTSITGNANLVKKVAFPRALLPVSVTLAALVNFLLTLLVQFALLFFVLRGRGAGISPWALLLPLAVLHHTVFNAGLALLTGCSNVYYRDTQHLVGPLLTAWFFLSPVMYHLDFVAQFAVGRPWVMDLYLLNPMAAIVTAYRAMILPDIAFPWTPFSFAGLLLPLALAGGAWAVFRRGQGNFADLL